MDRLIHDPGLTLIEVCEFHPQSQSKKYHRALNPEPAAYYSNGLTATLQTTIAKLRESVILMQRAWQIIIRFLNILGQAQN